MDGDSGGGGGVPAGLSPGDLFDSGAFADVALNAFGRRFELHRAFLVRSPFFHRQFVGPWQEVQSHGDGMRHVQLGMDLDSSDFAVEALEASLRLLYTGGPLLVASGPPASEPAASVDLSVVREALRSGDWRLVYAKEALVNAALDTRAAGRARRARDGGEELAIRNKLAEVLERAGRNSAFSRRFVAQLVGSDAFHVSADRGLLWWEDPMQWAGTGAGEEPMRPLAQLAVLTRFGPRRGAPKSLGLGSLEPPAWAIDIAGEPAGQAQRLPAGKTAGTVFRGPLLVEVAVCLKFLLMDRLANALVRAAGRALPASLEGIDLGVLSRVATRHREDFPLLWQVHLAHLEVELPHCMECLPLLQPATVEALLSRPSLRVHDDAARYFLAEDFLGSLRPAAEAEEAAQDAVEDDRSRSSGLDSEQGAELPRSRREPTRRRDEEGGSLALRRRLFAAFPAWSLPDALVRCARKHGSVPSELLLDWYDDSTIDDEFLGFTVLMVNGTCHWREAMCPEDFASFHFHGGMSEGNLRITKLRPQATRQSLRPAPATSCEPASDWSFSSWDALSQCEPGRPIVFASIGEGVRPLRRPVDKLLQRLSPRAKLSPAAGSGLCALYVMVVPPLRQMGEGPNEPPLKRTRMSGWPRHDQMYESDCIIRLMGAPLRASGTRGVCSSARGVRESDCLLFGPLSVPRNGELFVQICLSGRDGYWG